MALALKPGSRGGMAKISPRTTSASAPFPSRRRTCSRTCCHSFRSRTARGDVPAAGEPAARAESATASASWDLPRSSRTSTLSRGNSKESRCLLYYFFPESSYRGVGTPTIFGSPHANWCGISTPPLEGHRIAVRALSGSVDPFPRNVGSGLRPTWPLTQASISETTTS
jgi:hypothetical protein